VNPLPDEAVECSRLSLAGCPETGECPPQMFAAAAAQGEARAVSRKPGKVPGEIASSAAAGGARVEHDAGRNLRGIDETVFVAGAEGQGVADARDAVAAACAEQPWRWSLPPLRTGVLLVGQCGRFVEHGSGGI